MTYVEKFEELGFGLFVHFGLYSIQGQGEWYLSLNPNKNQEKYFALTKKFRVRSDWAKNLVKTAKSAGCKYITLTTRHHDGFSLYDTHGLNQFDAPHSACGRDLIKEFVDECNAQGITPFFYHTLLDWWHQDYRGNFSAYIDYLIASVEILCKNYGKIGGFWFDGMWDKPNEDWQEDRLYATIRKYQPTAMIINNTGLDEQGKVGHYEIDSVTFERGKPCFVDNSDRRRAGEMCQVLNDHWGYAKEDCNYKSVKELIENLVDCRKFNCNFLLNTGLLGNGNVNAIDKAILLQVGKWILQNKGFIYNVKSSEIHSTDADVLLGSDGYYYAVIKGVEMVADENVQRKTAEKTVTLNRPILNGIWLDTGEPLEFTENQFKVKPFAYGKSLSVRIAKIKLK